MARKATATQSQLKSFRVRTHCVAACMLVGALVLLGRAVHLQVFNKDFLNEQAAARHLRVAQIVAHRGAIMDRNGH